MAFAQAGELAWKETSITQAAKSTDREATAVFTFTNTSGAPVTIGKISTSCGCTTVEPSLKLVPPGESGTLQVVFKFGGRKGKQQKTIAIQTKGQEEATSVLTLLVEIPDPVRVDKPELVWKVGGPKQTQVFQITIDDPSTVRVKGFKAPGAAFTGEMKEVEPGRKYRVSVTPSDTRAPQKAMLKLEISDPMPRAVHLPVAVRP